MFFMIPGEKSALKSTVHVPVPVCFLCARKLSQTHADDADILYKYR